jgi:hypothetical protein
LIVVAPQVQECGQPPQQIVSALTPEGGATSGLRTFDILVVVVVVVDDFVVDTNVMLLTASDCTIM